MKRCKFSAELFEVSVPIWFFSSAQICGSKGGLGMFKFIDFLTPEEQEALNKLREKLGGKTIYIRYPERNPYREYLEKRNARIRKMFVRLKKLGLSNNTIYAEISIRLTCAKGLSESQIRKIVHGYIRKRKSKCQNPNIK
jgi:hypothetical protein